MRYTGDSSTNILLFLLRYQTKASTITKKRKTMRNKWILGQLMNRIIRNNKTQSISFPIRVRRSKITFRGRSFQHNDLGLMQMRKMKREECTELPFLPTSESVKWEKGLHFGVKANAPENTGAQSSRILELYSQEHSFQKQVLELPSHPVKGRTRQNIVWKNFTNWETLKSEKKWENTIGKIQK